MGTLFAVVFFLGAGLTPLGESRAIPPGPPLPIEIVAVSPGDQGPLVELLQQQLTDAGFLPGYIDGRYGGATHGAVLAFQKLHGLERNGVFLPEHWDLLSLKPTVRMRREPDRVEVDLGRQVLFLVRDNRVQVVVPVSSGNGATFPNNSGRLVRAVTPEGRFTFYFQRANFHRSYLGFMYKPFYFRGGYAIHGSASVPPYPASHGCIRVTNANMDFLRQHLELGMTVYVYGQRTANPPGIFARPGGVLAA